MAEYRFVPPTVKQTPMAWNRLMVRYGIDRGQSVLMINNYYTTTQYPAQTELAEASEYYLGGHAYIIDQATKDRLTNPSIGGVFGDYITEL
jgi:hypothetical protein